MSILNTTNTPIGISFATASPTRSDNISAGYPISQEWFNKKTGERFYHKADGVWVSYASTDTIGEAPVMFVDVATTAQFDGSYNNGVGGVGATLTSITNGSINIDGVPLNLDVVVLVKDQSVGDFEFGSPNLQYQNGVYIVTRAGTPTLSVILTRVDFADESDELYPSQVNVLDGTVNQNKFFLQESENPLVGTASIVYTTNLIPPIPEVIAPVVFVDTVTTEPLPSCTYTNIYNPVVPGQWWYLPFPIDATITANANGPLGTINGVVMGNSFTNRSNRILVKNQVNKNENGDYRVVNAGSSTMPWKLQRITKNSGSMITSVREWKVNNENSKLYGNRYNLKSNLQSFKLGLSSLEFSEISSSLGLIRIVDILGQKFTDLTTARAYVKTFTSAVISDESFNDGVYYFTVPSGSNFDLTVYFLSYTSALIIDEFGLIDSFGEYAFFRNTGNNILGNCVFVNNAFAESEGDNALGNCTFVDAAFSSSKGDNRLGDCTFVNAAFSGSTGNNVLGNCPSFSGSAFYVATGNNILGNCNNFGSNAFYAATGDNVLGDCPNFGVNAFSISTGNNTIGNCTFAENAFMLSTGNNQLGDCSFGVSAFHQSTGHNLLGNCVFSPDAFEYSEGDNRLGNCTFGDTAFNLSIGNNLLGTCSFGNNAFVDSSGNNVLGNCLTFGYNAFIQSTGNNVLGDCPSFGINAFKSTTGNNILGNCTFGSSAFSLSSGNNTLRDCTFANSAFQNTTGNNTLRDCVFGNNPFNNGSGYNTLRDCTFTDGAFQFSAADNTIRNCTFSGIYAFNGATGSNNTLGNCTFGEYAFYNANGINKFKNILLSSTTHYFGLNSQGRFEIYGNIGTTEGANYPNFFQSSTAVIWADKSKETSNSGQLEGDLATARTNGAKLFFGYEKPQISEVLVTGLLTGGGSSSSITIGTDPTIATGSGVFGYVPYWKSSQNLSSTSSIYNVGTNVGISNFSPTHPLTIGSSVSGIGGQISLQGRTSGNVVIKTSDVTSSWTASLPTTKGSITPFVYSNFGGEIMLNDGNGNLFFGTTPSLSLSENTVFIGNTYGYAKSRTLMGDIYSDYTGTITINNGVVSYQKIQTVSQAAVLGSTVAGGVVTEIPFFDYLITPGTITNNLENPSNWLGGTYSGPLIAGTYQGQSHYNSTYFFTAVEDNNWIRILRS